MKKYYADRNSLNILRVITLILLIVLGIALRYLLFFLQERYPDYFAVPQNTVTEIIIWSVILAAVAIYVLYILIFLPLWYNNARYYVTDKDIIARTGVFVKKQQYMKLDSVQYTTRISAAFSKHTGFNFIMFNGYGGRMMFLFLSASDADEITKHVRRRIKENEALKKKEEQGDAQ